MSMTTHTQLSAAFLRDKHNAAAPFDAYLAAETKHADKAATWREVYDRARLSETQRRLVQSFARDMPVLVVSGVWCGDCVQQCPLLARIAETNPRIDLRFLDRDLHADLAAALSINQGLRVPVAVFMAEDYEVVSIFGDRTLTRYRAIAQKTLGPHCPLPGAPLPQDELEATLQDWLDEFERVHLILRLSGRLRERHGD